MRTKLAALVGSVALAGAVTVVGLPASASAATMPSACPKELVLPVPVTSKATTNVNLRSGPKSSSTSKGLLTKGTTFDEYCMSGGSTSWSYGKVLSGANKGKWGWVVGTYLKQV
ncbi:SH3 domain-containing protein [Streptomyces niveiscabiei]|uniref:SH3 domain-containing protein n=1 Tax=Streptomyces niveiscabiei TaxID=164115 RepID=UPI0029A36822|nr:SH3 domain-containing protein [Streptomyces niveiscabiei]MDX3387515.1 SH3 domain-containing protein [Streptomyces niveiscabiei]